MLATTAVKAVGASLLPLAGDEAYYYDCSRHLDWCYFDQPGLVIWTMIPFRALLGEVTLAVRAPALLASLLFGFFCWRIIRRFGGTNRQGALCWGLLHATPLFLFGSGYVSTDVAMSACYAGAVLAAMTIASGDRRGWWGFGLAVGLGFLAKYPIVIVLAVLVPVLARPQARADLRTATPWLAALFGVALTAPVWIWAMQHDWANIRFQLGRVPAGGDPLVLLEFWGASLVLLTPTIWIAALVAWLLARRFGSGPWAVYRWGVATPMIFWSLMALRGHVGAHWGAAGLMLAMVGVVMIPFRWRRQLVAAGIATTGVVVVVVFSLFAFPSFWLNLERELRVRQGRPHKVELVNLFGTEEVAAEVRRRLRPGEIAASERYTDVHLVSFLTGGQVPTRLLGSGRHGLAALYWDRPEELEGRDFLYFTTAEHKTWRLPQMFDAVERLEPYIVKHEGQVVRTYLFFRCRNLREPSPLFTLLPRAPDAD
jgi:4-amino-4-deoxy-L-arabinose transferase-like glycosyltransferase